MERPDGLSTSPTVSRSKAPAPAGSLANTSLFTLTGQAASQPDPMRGRIVQEGSPEARQLLAAQKEKVDAARTAHNLAIGDAPPKKKSGYQPGHRIYHEKRKEYGVVVKASSDGKMIEVIFPHAQRKRVQIANIRKA